MTRDQIFGAALGGAIVLALASAMLTPKDNDDGDYTVHFGNSAPDLSGDEIVIENRGEDVIVHTKDGTINCTKNGGKVTIQREDGTTREIICE